MSYIFFARWFSLITLLLSFGVLFNLEDAQRMAKNMVDSESGYIMGGVLPIIFGSLSFMHQNSFVLGWPLLVTLIGMFLLLVGAFRVLFVKQWKHLIGSQINKIPFLFSLFGLMLSVVLAYVGFVAPVIS